jgi:hypothetical protein
VPSDHKGRYQKIAIDPYTRHFGPSFVDNNCVIIDPTSFRWTDQGFHTPDPSQLIIYEMSIYGFTEGDGDIKPEHRGTFKGVTERINAGYFDQLGVTALSIMPLTGSLIPRAIARSATIHQSFSRSTRLWHGRRPASWSMPRMERPRCHIDEVFSHTDNGFNPLWQLILDIPMRRTIPRRAASISMVPRLGATACSEKIDVQTCSSTPASFLSQSITSMGSASTRRTPNIWITVCPFVSPMK